MDLFSSVFFVVFLFVLLAEVGDKTQLVVIALASKYKIIHVISGVFLSILCLNLLAVSAGRIIYTILPIGVIQTTASFAFIIFGLISLRTKDEEVVQKNSIISNPILASFITFFIAELGDKTQLATMMFAAKYSAPLLVFCGAVLGMIVADIIGIVVGAILSRYISQNYIKGIAGLLFIAFGIYGLVNTIPIEQLTTIIDSMAVIFVIGAMTLVLVLLKKEKAK